MAQTRREFLTGAAGLGALGWVAGCTDGSGGWTTVAVPDPERPRGMARGLTLLTLRREGQDRLGVRTDQGILDVPSAARILGRYAPATMHALLQEEDGPSVQDLVAAALDAPEAAPAFLNPGEVEYGPLLRRPDKVVCVGLNYRKHAEEIGAAVPEWPVLFNKFSASLNRHGGTIELPVEHASQFDYEVELVIVMGRRARNVPESEALDHVAGYATGNDFTSRDLQSGRGGQWMIGKAIDGFAPLGPHLVTADQVDPDRLALECRVNGEVRQSSTTADFIFDTRFMVSYISRFFTLEPGDIIFTGTPEGVIAGLPPEEQVWLRAGDRIDCSVAGLGELTFHLV